VKAYDPVAMDIAKPLLPNVTLCPDPYSLAEGCDALVIVTEWNEFKQLDLIRIKDLMKQPVIMDGRNLYEPEKVIKMGYRYRGLGRGFNGNQNLK